MCVKSALKLACIIIILVHFKHNEAFRWKFTNLVCESLNKSWIICEECRLKAVNRNKTTLTAFVFLKEPAYEISVKVQILKKANGYKPWVIDYKLDVCDFLKKRNHPFANWFYDLFKDVSTMNHTCPYVGLVGIRDFYEINRIPSVFPNGDYLLNVTWFLGKKPQYVARGYFSFFDNYYNF